MGLAKLCAKVATKAELAELLGQLEEENNRFRMAILWALGENGDFAPEPLLEGKIRKPYYWRTELRNRAGL